MHVMPLSGVVTLSTAPAFPSLYLTMRKERLPQLTGKQKISIVGDEFLEKIGPGEGQMAFGRGRDCDPGIRPL
jgi:hypothetical protein